MKCTNTSIGIGMGILCLIPLPTAPHSPVVVVREFPPDPKVSQSLLLRYSTPAGVEFPEDHAR